MQSMCSSQSTATSSSLHMHHHHALVCSNLRPTSFRLARGRPTIFGGYLETCALPSRRLTASKKRKDEINRRGQKGGCCAALADDAPFALAIGASILSTLVLPVPQNDQENKENSLFGPDDVRSGAMQIISFIPLFNWLVWVFAWLDTQQPRYLAFSAVYLAPYLKTGLSVSPDDSWLPIASILACIVHVQLDISVSAEGAEPPLEDMSQALLEKTRIKDLGIRAEGLAARLKELSDKSDVRPFDKAVQEDDQTKRDEWKAIQEEILEKEFADWDAKLSKSEVIEKSAKEIDS